MTSGSFHSIAIETIQINREERQRRELPDIAVLADSISRLGLIHPVVITRDRVLVAGERRMAAVTELGWTHINAQYTDDLDAATLHAIELEENVKRKDLTWQDECNAVLAYHNFRKTEDPQWGLADTGEALGFTKQTISSKLFVAEQLAAGNTRVIEAPRFSTAKGIVVRAAARREEAAVDALHTQLNAAPRVVEPEPIINTDFNEWATTYSGPRFNFVHCDFPYGINANKFHLGAAASHGGYADSEEVYWQLCQTLVNNLDRITTESCHFMFWYSMHYHTATLDFFERNSDIKLDPFPLIWVKSDNVGITPDPTRGPRRIYETCLFGSRGDRKIANSVANSYVAPSDRTSHMSIKPEPMLRHFFRMFVDESTIFLDPTCGSGSSVRAAEAAGAQYVQGLEQNPEFAVDANRAALKARALRKASDAK